jgi:isocitrate dehydrogenase
LYLRYLATEGKEANFNSSALLYALANALEHIAEKEHNAPLLDYSHNLKQALIDTVAQGIITGDLKGKTTEPDKERVVDMFGFLDAVEENLLSY